MLSWIVSDVLKIVVFPSNTLWLFNRLKKGALFSNSLKVKLVFHSNYPYIDEKKCPWPVILLSRKCNFCPEK